MAMKKEGKKDLKYELIEHIADISVASSGWSKEVNIIKWGNSKTPTIDIRKWNRSDEENIIVGKGVSLSLDEFKILQKINMNNLKRYFD